MIGYLDESAESECCIPVIGGHMFMKEGWEWGSGSGHSGTITATQVAVVTGIMEDLGTLGELTETI